MNKKYILGVFTDEDNLVEAFEKVKEQGIVPDEVYTPYPVHEILLGMKTKTKITHAAFFYGVFSVIGILAFLYYAAVISWPLKYGGKPFNSFPSFIVITIVATILMVTILTLFTFSVRAKIYPGKEPEIFHNRATDDKFVIVIDREKLAGKEEVISGIFRTHGVVE